MILEQSWQMLLSFVWGVLEERPHKMWVLESQAAMARN